MAPCAPHLCVLFRCHLGGEHRRVVKDWQQPALRLGDAPALAPGIVLNLVALDLADAEIAGIGMAEIEAADRSARPHGKALGERHADRRLAVEQAEQRLLLGVIWLRGIAWRRADA